MDLLQNIPLIFYQNGAVVHISRSLYDKGFRNVLFPSDESWNRAKRNVIQWIHVKITDTLIGHRFFVGYDLVFHKDGLNRTEDIYIYYVLTYAGCGIWCKHISTFWADNDTQPYPFHVHMFDFCNSFVFNGLWDGIEGERILGSNTTAEIEMVSTE